ncbi:MAG: saccharopine dehydrogenase C-terminal domain-containing protein [Bacteroidota bacterium]|jgi:saccharopine dehydrogenase-like NADP-dependent oxidoreductase
MKRIFVIGAGKSTAYLIKYLLDKSETNNWKVIVGDVDINTAQSRISGHPNGVAVSFDVFNHSEREKYISESDLVISMLPATLHGQVAKDCVRFGKHMTTASYVSKEMKELDSEAKAKGLILFNEVGLDPGIDHASAMKIIDGIHSEGGEIEVFKSYCGGLVAPESNDNPWGYKFSWNPRNVILAGQGTAQYLQNGELKFIPYNRIFKQIEHIEVKGLGTFDGYANRDSISYQEPYQLNGIKTLLRGTLRMQGYCNAWNVFVHLGLTDDSWKLPEWGEISWPELLKAFLPGMKEVKKELIEFSGIIDDHETIEKLEWLGIFDERNKIIVSGKSPAQVLQELLEKKWFLKPGDKDMIVMQHIFKWRKKDNPIVLHKTHSSLVVIGQDQTYTAMAKTVGLPLAMVSSMILQNKVQGRGVMIPVTADIYQPLLKELEEYDISFREENSND